jgi:RHS repeat-associated protein
VSVSGSWLAGLPAWAFPVVIDPTFAPDPLGPSVVVSESDTQPGVPVTGEMQNGVATDGRTIWRSAAYMPAPPAQLNEPGDPNPWQLSTGVFKAQCQENPNLSCTGNGLSGLAVYGAMSTPASDYPNLFSIPASTSSGWYQISVNPASSDQAEIGVDMSDFMRLLTNGTWEGGGWVAIEANEPGDLYTTVQPIDLSTVFASWYYVEQPPPTTITAPSGVIATATPALTATPVTDSNCGQPGCQAGTPAYDFQISTAVDGTGTIADSGWLPDPSWPVPPGSLHDGVTYYATVRTSITSQIDRSSPDYVAPGVAGPTDTITVKERLGSGGPSPTDTVGSPPQGTSTPSQGTPSPGLATASETVNMLTGNLALDVATPQMQALSGNAGVTLAYNSLSSSTVTGAGNYGLTGQYYTYSADANGSPSFTGSTLVGQRTDSAIDENWVDAPAGGLSQFQPFMIKWTGYVTLPTLPAGGTWQLGGLTSDGSAVDGSPGCGPPACAGMRVYMTPQGGSQTTAYDDWGGSASTASPSYGAATFSGGAQYKIEVDDWDLRAATPSTVQLWAESTPVTDPNTLHSYLVPTWWLTPDESGVPAGWSLLANGPGVVWTHADDQGDQVVLSDGSGNTATFTRTSAGEYLSPPGDTDYLSTGTSGGDLQLSTSSDQLYTFNPDGSLASMTTIADDLHPAALQYTYTGSPAVLTSITDPVSGRSISLSYVGSGACPASPPSGDSAAPPGMLCQITYWDNSSTTFWYTGTVIPQIAEVIDPGSQVTQFGYDADNRLADIRDPLASAYLNADGQTDPPVACPPGTTGLGTVVAADTQICYDSAGRVAFITQPEPASGQAGLRPGRTYNYGNGGITTMSISGVSPSSGYAEKVQYDGQGRIFQTTDSAGHTTTTVWANVPPPDFDNVSSCLQTWSCGLDEPIVSVSSDGDQTSTVYDAKGNITDTYGAAPVACFDPGTWPSNLTSTTGPAVGYLPVANPVSTTGCGVAVPHTHNDYDQGMTGLAETYWSNGQFAGAAALHATGDGGPQTPSLPECTTGTLCTQWTTPPVSSDGSGHWSVTLTGTITAPAAGPYGGTSALYAFGMWSTQPATLSIDGTQLLDDAPDGWPQPDPATFTAGQPNAVSQDVADGGAGYSMQQGSVHQIKVTFEGAGSQLSQANEFAVYYSYYDPVHQDWPSYVIPNTLADGSTSLDPDYGLQTSTTSPDGVTTTTGYTGGGLDPAYGLPTSATVGAGSATPLTTNTTYEPPGVGSYLRKLSTTLPGGNTTTDQYYTGTSGGTPLSNTCGVSSATPQGGQLESLTSPAREQQFVYDAAGRQAGVRTGPASTISSQPWQCTSYDALGRITSQTWPQLSTTQPAQTVTYTYGYNPGTGGNPLSNSVTDGATTVSSTVDLLGRVASYTDAQGVTTTTTYDHAGQVLSTASSPFGTITSAYDPDSGQLTGVTYTSAGNSVPLATATYDSSGRLSGVSYGNGTTAAISYDSYGNENSLSFANRAGNLATDQVTYDAGGQITTEQQSFTSAAPANSSPSGGPDYSYDGAGRLASAWLQNGSQAAYSYGAENSSCPPGTNPGAGANTNRTAVTTTPPSGSAATTSYCYNNADQLTATITGTTTTSSYAYDARGNQTIDGANTLTWDASGRNTSITTTGGSTTSLTYDPVNRVVSRQANGTTTRYWYDGYTDSPAGTISSNGQTLQEFIGLPGGVTVTMQASGDTWSYPDLQGNVTITTSNTGNPQGSTGLYEPWGQLLTGQPVNNAAGGSDLGAYGTDGKITDTASGIITMGARAYNPAEARFLTVDPLAGGCANAYVYAYGDPLEHPDLTGQGCGHSIWDWIGLALGVVAVATGIGGLIVGATAWGIGLGITATVAGTAAIGLDARDCHRGKTDACWAVALGSAGTALGGVSTYGAGRVAAGAIKAGSSADVWAQGAGALSFSLGGTAAMLDIGRTFGAPDSVGLKASSC